MFLMSQHDFYARFMRLFIKQSRNLAPQSDIIDTQRNKKVYTLGSSNLRETISQCKVSFECEVESIWYKIKLYEEVTLIGCDVALKF